MDHGLNDTALSRMYYAAFYAINALLFKEGFIPKTHNGTKSLFNKEFIQTQKIDSKFSDFYSFLMAKRFEADYDDFAFINLSNLPAILSETERFVSLILGMIKENDL